MKLSGDPWTASGMLDKNKPHEAPVRAFLTALVRDEKSHAKFLNMLSMLEHMGSRKIMVSQMNKSAELDQDILQHLSEEARHAYFFKRHAERINGAPMKGWIDSNTMCRVPALMYFGRMDAGITQKLKSSSSRWRTSQEVLARTGSRKDGSEAADIIDPRCSSYAAQSCGDDNVGEPYGWVSLIIELRACWLYRIYNDVIEAADIHLPLKGLIAEEDGHLEEMFGICGENYDLLKELSAYETALFKKLWSALENEYPKSRDNREAA